MASSYLDTATCHRSEIMYLSLFLSLSSTHSLFVSVIRYLRPSRNHKSRWVSALLRWQTLERWQTWSCTRYTNFQGSRKQYTTLYCTVLYILILIAISYHQIHIYCFQPIRRSRIWQTKNFVISKFNWTIYSMNKQRLNLIRIHRM